MDNQNRKTCAFTGHRLHKLPGCEVDGSLKRLELIDRIEVVILTLIERMGVCHFITGMALGVDTYAAQSVLRIKNKHPHITLEAAIPCRDQEKKWSDKQKQIYYSILDRCDKITLVQEKYSRGCMMKRNRYMVDNADILFAVWDKSSGGTGNTVNYALSLIEKGEKKEIIRLDPQTLCLEKM